MSSTETCKYSKIASNCYVIDRLTAFTFGRKLDKQEYSQLDFQKQYEEVYSYMD